VLCSGRGSNLQALIDAAATGSLPVDIRAVVSDRPHCYALERARLVGIPTRVLRPRDHADRAGFDHALFAEVARFDPRLVVFAGYMRIVDDAAINQWRGPMINIHPSLLPKYPGLHTHERALDAGDAMHGSSVHFVTAELDGGPLIAQARLPVERNDTPASLAARLLPVEHRLLVASAGLFAAGKVMLENNRVVYDGQVLATPLILGANDQFDRS
jgi:phosphoribosylglycinamide formyltransferase-1